MLESVTYVAPRWSYGWRSRPLESSGRLAISAESITAFEDLQMQPIACHQGLMRKDSEGALKMTGGRLELNLHFVCLYT